MSTDLIFVDQLNIAKIREFKTNFSHSEFSRVYCIHKLRQAAHLRHGGHLQQLHVEAEQEPHCLRGHSRAPDNKTIDDSLVKSKCLMNLDIGYTYIDIWFV